MMRVIRLLVYEGPEEWIQYMQEHDSIKGKFSPEKGKTITSIILGAVPDELSMFLDYNETDEEKINEITKLP
jgi:hypothetical protein